MPAPNCLLLGFSLREAELRAQCLAAALACCRRPKWKHGRDLRGPTVARRHAPVSRHGLVSPALLNNEKLTLR
jgi:hypothetical protein